MKRNPWFVFAGGSPAPLASAQAPAPGPASHPPRHIEERADRELKRMGEFLAKLPRFALEAEETFDELSDGQLRRQLTNVRRIALERPNHVAADATGDTLNRASWYDGRTVTVLDKEHNVYATIEAPATIDATIDKLRRRVRGRAAACRLPVRRSLRRADRGRDVRALPRHPPGGGRRSATTSLSRRTTIEWQIWIDAGEKPLPRKLVISYVDEAGEPQYTATIRRWSLDVKVPDGLFTFEAPEGAQKIDASTLRAGRERSRARLGQRGSVRGDAEGRTLDGSRKSTGLVAARLHVQWPWPRCSSCPRRPAYAQRGGGGRGGGGGAGAHRADR